MKKIHIPFIIVLLIFLSYAILAAHGSVTYKDVPITKITNATTPKDVLAKVLETKEFFTGSVEVKYLDREKNTLEIKLQNKSVGDDSITADEYIYKAAKKSSSWEILETKVHWKCRNHYFFNFWTTRACI